MTEVSFKVGEKQEFTPDNFQKGDIFLFHGILCVQLTAWKGNSVDPHCRVFVHDDQEIVPFYQDENPEYALLDLPQVIKYGS